VDTTDLQDALAQYIRILAKSADSTHDANSRPLYDLHLAEAARLFAELRAGDLAAVRAHIARERRAFGWSFLPGREGEVAEHAWDEFAKLLPSTT
jgi:hypothetical protein